MDTVQDNIRLVIQGPMDSLVICFVCIKHGAVYFVRIGHHTRPDIIRSAPPKTQELAGTVLAENVLVFTVESYHREQQLRRSYRQ